jgi:hypothetical protein
VKIGFFFPTLCHGIIYLIITSLKLKADLNKMKLWIYKILKEKKSLFISFVFLSFILNKNFNLKIIGLVLTFILIF